MQKCDAQKVAVGGEAAGSNGSGDEGHVADAEPLEFGIKGGVECHLADARTLLV